MHVVCIYTPRHTCIHKIYIFKSNLSNLFFKNQSFCVSLKDKIPYSWVSKNHLSERLKFCSVHLSFWSFVCRLVSGFIFHLFCLSVPLSTLSLQSLYKCLAPLRLTVFCSFPSLLVWLLVMLEIKPKQAFSTVRKMLYQASTSSDYLTVTFSKVSWFKSFTL